MTGCYRPAINTFVEDPRKQKIDELNAAPRLQGPGHNRATAKLALMLFRISSKDSRKKS